MHQNYHDIRSRIDAVPLWYDEKAVPRYVPFEPRFVANIYASEVVLARVECQACGHPFNVAFSATPTGAASRAAYPEQGPLLADLIRGDALKYGDPPNIGCCPAGATMGSVMRRVLEYWVKPYVTDEGRAPMSKPGSREFRRDPSLEGEMAPD